MHKKFIFFAIIYMLLSITLFDCKLFSGGDNARYIILAQSISQGKGYKELWDPDEPEHTLYPPLLPIILSIPIVIFGYNLMLLKFVIVLFGLGTLYFVYKIAGYYFTKNRFIFTLAWLSLLVIYRYNSYILTEIPFLCFTLGSIWFIIKNKDHSHQDYIISFCLATMAVATRFSGVVLLLSIAIYLLIKKQHRMILILSVISLSFIIPWTIRSLMYGKSEYLTALLLKNPYNTSLGNIGVIDYITRCMKNIYIYLYTVLPNIFLSLRYKSVDVIVLYATATACIVCYVKGFINCCRRILVIKIYFILSLIMLLSWNEVWSADRFALPIIPILLLFMFKAFKLTHNTVRIVAFIIALNFTAAVIRSISAVSNNIEYIKGNKLAGYPDNIRKMFEEYKAVDEYYAKDVELLTRKPEFLYILTNRKSKNVLHK